MPDWTTACPDWERRIVAGEPLIPFKPLFPDEAKRARNVFDSLKIVDAPGSPTFGEVGRSWLFDFHDAIFGAYDPEAGRRLINEFFLLISKKNSKSSGAAGIMLTALMQNWRKSGEFYIIAPTIEIANNSFFPARDMVREDDELRDLCHVQEHYRTITHRETKALLKVIAADDETVGGKKGIGVLVDEHRLFGKRSNADAMLREATGGRASRPEGFTIYLSTQSAEPPAGVFKQKLDYARGVRDGRIKNKRFLPVIYEFPKAMLDDGSFKDRKFYYITNPNLGASVDPEFLDDEYSKSEEAGRESLTDFFAKHLNVEIGLNLRSDRWSGAEYWLAAEEPELVTLDDLLARSDVVVVGGDGGGLDDLLGLAVIGRERITRRLLLWCHAWAHSIVLERRKEIAPRLRDFARDGDLTIIEQPGEDVEQFADIVEQIHHSGLLPQKNGVGVDPVGIAQIVDEIVARGVSADCIVGISQGWRLSGAIKTAERGLADGSFVHAPQPIMDWCVGNAKVEPRGNAVTITKATAGSAKIDPLMAMFDAVSLMAMHPEAQSIYEERGLLMI